LGVSWYFFVSNGSAAILLQLLMLVLSPRFIRADFDPVGVICVTNSDSGAIGNGNEDHTVRYLDVNFRSKSQGILVILFFHFSV